MQPAVDIFGHPVRLPPAAAQIEQMLGELEQALAKARRREVAPNPKLMATRNHAIQRIRDNAPDALANLRNAIGILEAWAIASDVALRHANEGNYIDVRFTLKRQSQPAAAPAPSGPQAGPDAKTIIVQLRRRGIALALTPEDELIAVENHGSRAKVQLLDIEWIPIRAREKELRRILEREQV